MLGSVCMKYLGMLLILAVVVHLQCDGSCLADMLNAKAATTTSSAEPPCHQHQQPSDSTQPHHDNVSSCTQGPIIEAKAAATGKCILDATAGLVLVSPLVRFTESVSYVSLTHYPPDNSFFISVGSVLRI